MNEQDSNPRTGRSDAFEIFRAALHAVDPAAAVERAVIVNERQVLIAGQELSSATRPRKIVAISIGKAAYTMAAGLTRALGRELDSGIAVGPATVAPEDGGGSWSRWQCLPGGHPLPTDVSLQAGRMVRDFVSAHDSDESAIVFLISGGGSAMVELPVDPTITAADLQQLNSLLLATGAPIGEINIVRRAVSAIKGGRLAAAAAKAIKVSLIVSDTPQGEESSVASGPTIAPAPGGPTPRDFLAKYDLIDRLPKAISQAIQSDRSSEHPPPVSTAYKVILQNADAIDGAAARARELGYETVIADDISDQDIDEGCRAVVERAISAALSRPLCVLSGGEFVCPVRGAGRGGRSTESALRIAMLASERGLATRFTVLCAGTDGIDGNSLAAGAIADATTLQSARLQSLNAIDFLDNSDAFSFFNALGDMVNTGPTGTNVRDLRILLVWPSS